MFSTSPMNGKQRIKPNRMSDAGIMLIMILFHSGDYRCFKHFYLEYVCKHLAHLFPRRVSYNQSVKQEKEVLFPLAIFIKTALLGICTGISFVYSTSLVFTEEIKGTVISLLEEGYSPEQIKGRSNVKSFAIVSHETMYRWIWEDNARKVLCTNTFVGKGRNTTSGEMLLQEGDTYLIVLISKNVLQL